MVENITFTLQFVFEDKDHTKALALHNLLKKYGAVSAIIHNKKYGDGDKHHRMESILSIMCPGIIYTTGKLWNKYARISSTGMKTFQRDLNTLAIEGKVEGIHVRSKGNTILWSRRY